MSSDMQDFGELFTARDQLHIRKRDGARFDHRNKICHDRADHRREHGQRHALPAQVAAHDSAEPGIHASGDDRHEHRAQQRTRKAAPDVQPLMQRAAQEDVVHDADDHIARERADRRADDVELRHCDQKPVDRDLGSRRLPHRPHGAQLCPVACRTAVVMSEMHTNTDSKPQKHQQHRPGVIAVRIEHVHDRVAEHGEPDTHRHGDDRRDAQRRLRNIMSLCKFLLHNRGSNRRNDADRHRRHERSRKVKECQRFPVDAVENVCVCLRIAQRRLQPVHDELGVDEVDDAQNA